MLFFEIHKVLMYAFAAFSHLASLDARELFSTKYAGVGHGTVGYADRSASCVSPPYALLPFLPPKRIAEGAKAISPDIWRETL